MGEAGSTTVRGDYRISQQRDGLGFAWVFTYPGIHTAGHVEKNAWGRWVASVKVGRESYDLLDGDHRTRRAAAEAVMDAYEALR